MFKVISIRKIRRKPRCKLTLDIGDYYEISLDLVVKHQLKKNQTLSENKLKKILTEQKTIDCKQAAYYYASYKPRTEQQVIEKLKQKGFNTPEIKNAINFLKEFDLLDDKRFAENYIKNTLRRKPAGKFKLSADLRQKGIEKDTAAAAIEKVFPHEDTLKLAMEAATKKMRLIAGKEKSKQKTSLISFLKNRGFDWDTIKQVIEKQFEDDD